MWLKSFVFRTIPFQTIKIESLFRTRSPALITRIEPGLTAVVVLMALRQALTVCHSSFLAICSISLGCVLFVAGRIKPGLAAVVVFVVLWKILAVLHASVFGAPPIGGFRFTSIS